MGRAQCLADPVLLVALWAFGPEETCGLSQENGTGDAREGSSSPEAIRDSTRAYLRDPFPG